MPDKITKERRSLNMAAIRSKNTKPELLVRKAVYQKGIRYRLNVSKLPGKPDIYIPRLKTAIFIHGCFWHQHPGCKRNFMPKSNLSYWQPKLERNILRFAAQKRELLNMGIQSIVVWECEAKNESVLNRRIEELS